MCKNDTIFFNVELMVLAASCMQKDYFFFRFSSISAMLIAEQSVMSEEIIPRGISVGLVKLTQPF